MTDPTSPGWAQPTGSSPTPPPPPAGAAPPPPPVGPPPSFGAVPPCGTPPPAWGPQGSGMPVGPPVKRGTNGLAVAALVLGIFWVCGLGSLLAVIFGFVALGQIKRLGVGGKGLAIAGIVLGIIGLLATVAVGVVAVVAADEVVTNQAGELDDVEIVRCSAGDGGRAEVTIDVTNDSSRRSTYFITIRVSEAGTSESLGTTVGPLDADGTDRIRLRSEVTSDFDDPRCEVEFVERVATD